MVKGLKITGHLWAQRDSFIIPRLQLSQTIILIVDGCVAFFSAVDFCAHVNVHAFETFEYNRKYT